MTISSEETARRNRAIKSADEYPERKSDSELAIDAFLDRFSAFLVAETTIERRKELRGEIKEEFLALELAYRELGFTNAQATEAALKRYGEPSRFAQVWLNESASKNDEAKLSPFVRSLLLFAPFFSFCLILSIRASGIQNSIFGVNKSLTVTAYEGAISLAPIIPGFLCGFLQTRDKYAELEAAMTAYLALIGGIYLFCFPFGLMDSDAALMLLGFAFLFWLPVSVASAMIGRLCRKAELHRYEFRRTGFIIRLVKQNRA